MQGALSCCSCPQGPQQGTGCSSALQQRQRGPGLHLALCCSFQLLSPRDGASGPCPAAPAVGQKAERGVQAAAAHGAADLAAAIPPGSAAGEEELLLQSHTSYYLPTKGSVCTAGREPEDRDSPADLHRTCSRQARALMSPDRCACRRPCTWPAQRSLPGCSPPAFSRYQLQSLLGSPRPGWVFILPARVKLSGLCKETKAMLCGAELLGGARAQAGVGVWINPCKHRFPGPAWQPELSEEPACSNWGWRLR